MNISLQPHSLTTLTLPNGQTIEIDLRDDWDWTLYVNNSAGDCMDHVSIADNDDEGNMIHPSLNAAERNSLMQ
jgi:hypothetical protein